MPHFSTPRRGRVTALVALFVAIITATTAFAVPPAPSIGSAVVDGDTSEWVPGDVFSDMLRAGGNGGQTEVESTLSLRYSCASQTLYALALAQPGVTVAANLPDESFIKVGGRKAVDGMSGDDGIAPDFAWVERAGDHAEGWEASLPLVPGSYTINVHAQVNDGGSQTSAVPGRSIPLVVQCDGEPELSPLTVTKTVETTYTRDFDWSLTKRATPASITTSADQATFTYTVTATKSAPVDSGFAVSGMIVVTNPNDTPVSGVTIADTLGTGQSCPVTNGANVTIPASGSVTVAYGCAVASAADGVNTAVATWSGGQSAVDVPFSFGTPTAVTDDVVHVTDSFNGAAAAPLSGANGVTETTSWTYTRSVPVPATGCTPFPNVAMLTSVLELVRQADARVEACRTTPPPPVVDQPPVAPPATAVGIQTAPPAALRLVKRGPAAASAGQVITFTIKVTNISATVAATSVTLSDILPAGYSLARRPAGAELKKGTITWTIGDLAPGASTTVRLQVRVDRNAAGSRCNNATASAGNAATVRARACARIARIAGVIRIPIVTG